VNASFEGALSGASTAGDGAARAAEVAPKRCMATIFSPRPARVRPLTSDR
jgi:hypothetical protein